MSSQAAYRSPESLDPGAPADAKAAQDSRVTPMMAQYIEIKAANPDSLLFYRMGDFYELFFEDAEIASQALGIVLTKRGKHQGQDIPMCGVPVERADDYLQRLIALGHRVAVCEQTEDPAEAKKRGSKSVVRRDVVRLVTPGTITEERLLEPGRANYLLAIARRRASDTQWCYGLAAVDISTGHFVLSETDGAGLSAEIARFEPREILVPDVIHDDPELRSFWQETRAAITPLSREGLDPASAERRLKDYFGVATLDAFGSFSPAEITAAGSALFYIAKTQIDSRPALNPPTRDTAGAALAIDAATRANLELTRTLSGERTGSLLATIDCTVTPGGARLLAERLAGPLTDPSLIRDRQDSVTALVENGDLRDRLRRILKRSPDLARALSRLSLGRGGPRDLACVRDGLFAARELGLELAIAPNLPKELSEAAQTLHGLRTDVADRLAAALADDLPLLKRDGGFIRPGFDPNLDELRELQQDSRRFIAALQARYATETGCRTLRVKHNHMIGYFVEVPQNVGEDLLREPWKDTFVHRQTMAGAMRFSTMELGELESKIASAADRALKIELALFDEMVQALLDLTADIAAAAEAIAVIDVTAALADLAVRLDWTRPVVDTSLAFTVRGGRHPVVEAALKREGTPFIANDADLSGKDAGHILLITGPNMGGKSTYLRQNALIVVLAQMGSYVPAREAHIGIVDRLFSRVGAADDLARGRSTFMVEMVETAAILNQATARSLVILDEIGRGTATFDGLSIAWAAIEHLHETNRCRALFATHFHELTALAERMARISNATLKVTEWSGEVVFLHEVVPGAADRSYGLQVARLAGLPAPVVERAKTILSELERSDREAPKRALLDDLPLFAVSVRNEPPAPPKSDALREALDALDPDQMTPREALDALYRLKAQR
ncbi:DNA mismatch repair protein MutS [Microvirga arsenatis]|uniref:DNA mismatch repair protein MutS n=1 Tax=Microvirga arsenatis TaxID=2692265 RepID=A0ABW9Z107_9HYPH|nr:DNA mismatch repair protein MutS [Microvirga arsenatis]NBJ11712.1 DNA mismatch repair protein MutS [Microvirga arsenatis]NBJ24993.1 DNA mismatch repair protein MutS [Microvirga arsenatis]